MHRAGLHRVEQSPAEQRHSAKRIPMKLRTLFYALVAPVALGISLLLFPANDQESPRIFDATVNRDCAPWDGPAFSILIRYEPGSIIAISIWRSPNLRFPAAFSFPDKTRTVGDVLYLPQFGSPTQLSGRVSFRQAEHGIPVGGEFDLRAPGGRQFLGKFKALWTDALALCG